jgi:methionyl-tRNA formyltransferase
MARAHDDAASGWRVVLITSVAPIAAGLAGALRNLGHEPVAVVAPRRAFALEPDIAMTDENAPSGIDVILARGKRSLEPLIGALEPDLILCWGFPWLIPPAVLAIPRLGAVNLHPAMLPRHRGPIPMAWAVRSGDGRFGVTWHRMDDHFDTGPILAQAPVPMDPDDFEIRVVAPRMFEIALGLLPGVLARIAAGDPGDPQRATGDEPYAGFFDTDYVDIDWAQPARSVHDQVRAWAFAMSRDGVQGPLATLDGQRVRVTRTTLTEPDVAADQAPRRMECADGPIWIVAFEPLEETPA